MDCLHTLRQQLFGQGLQGDGDQTESDLKRESDLYCQDKIIESV